MTASPPGWLVARNFVALGGGEVIARIVAFFATIYLARSLGAASYGVIGVATAVVLYLTRIVDAGMELGIGVREVAAHPERIGTIGPTMLLVRLLIALLVATLLTAVGLTVLPQPDGAVIAIYGLTLF